MFSLVLSGGNQPRCLVEHEVAPVLLVNVLDLFAHLAVEPLQPLVRSAQLVLEPQHDLDAGQVEPELRGQPLDQPEAFEVGLGVEAGVPACPLRADEALVLVDPQRLGVHADELGRDRDHVARPVVNQCSSSLLAEGPHMRSITTSPASYAVSPARLRATYARTSKYAQAATKIATISHKSGRSHLAPAATRTT